MDLLFFPIPEQHGEAPVIFSLAFFGKETRGEFPVRAMVGDASAALAVVLAWIGAGAGCGVDAIAHE